MSSGQTNQANNGTILKLYTQIHSSILLLLLLLLLGNCIYIVFTFVEKCSIMYIYMPCFFYCFYLHISEQYKTYICLMYDLDMSMTTRITDDYTLFLQVTKIILQRFNFPNHINHPPLLLLNLIISVTSQQQYS